MKVSVVVPTYKRADLLNRCLAALLAQDFDPEEYEIVIADDAASEATRELVEWWCGSPAVEENRPAIRYVPVTGAHGPAAARNIGWHAARGEVIAFTDDDCVPDSHWLTAGVAWISNSTVAVRGKIVMPLPDDPSDYQFDQSHLENSEFVTANCFVKRKVLEEIGGLDERFRLAWREDTDLYFMLLEHGIVVARAGDAIVVHPIRPAPWGISLSQQRKAMYNALLYKKHPELYRKKVQGTPPLNYYAIVLSLLLAALSVAGHSLTLAVIFLSAWLALTLQFCLRRLWNTSHAPMHILEMLLTSMIIPPTSIYWRLRGAIKFHVPFL